MAKPSSAQEVGNPEESILEVLWRESEGASFLRNRKHRVAFVSLNVRMVTSTACYWNDSTSFQKASA